MKKEVDIVQQMLDPRRMDQAKQPDFSLPKIKALSDVYETGVLCKARVFNDENNFFMPYILNLFPVEKAELISIGSSVEKIEPLCRVII